MLLDTGPLPMGQLSIDVNQPAEALVGKPPVAHIQPYPVIENWRGDASVQKNSYGPLIFGIWIVCGCLAEAEEPPRIQTSRPEIRILDAEGRILLSQDEEPLAVVHIRPVAFDPTDPCLASAAGGTPAVRGNIESIVAKGLEVSPTPMTNNGLKKSKSVLSRDSAKAKLKSVVPEIKIVETNAEQILEFNYPVPAGNPQDRLSVLLRVRKVSTGARLQISSVFVGPTRQDFAPWEKGPAPPSLEVAVQIFSDANDKIPGLEKADGERWTAGGTPAVRARTLAFGEHKFQRVHVSRSGPAGWSMERESNSLLLTSPLMPDPHAAGALGSFVLYIGAGRDDAPPEISAITLDKPQTPARDFVEGSARVYASGANPFLLSELAVIAEVACPPKSGGEPVIMRLPCFFWESPKTSSAEGEFRFRFAPPTEGLYGIRMVVVTATGQTRSDAVSLRAVSPASSGFVKIRRGERQLSLDDGSIFHSLGLNLINRGPPLPPLLPESKMYLESFIALARNGGNTARICLSQAGLTLEPEWTGGFDPTVAGVLDEIFRAAQARGIRLMLCLESASAISEHSAQHAYFHEKGGPLLATPEFFRNIAAKKCFQSRLTYVAARYGAYRSLLAWDLMDNVDQSWPILKQGPDRLQLKPEEIDLCRRARRDVQDWTEEMALHLKGMDQHEHPICITTTVDPGKPWLDLESLEHLDFVAHSAILSDLTGNTAVLSPAKQPAFKEAALVATWPALSREPGRISQPFFLVSLSADSIPAPPLPTVPLGSTKTIDGRQLQPIDVLSHNAVFAALASGISGAPLQDYPGNQSVSNIWKMFKPASIFISALREISETEGNEELRYLNEQFESATHIPIRVLGRVGRRGMAVWIQNEYSSWAAFKDNHKFDELRDLTLRLPGLKEGEYNLVWLNTWTGDVISSEKWIAPATKANALPSALNLLVPPFRRDIGLLITEN